MTKALTKVVYKPDSQSTDEYIVIVNQPEFQSWKGGDKTIPLADVVDSFQVFHSGQGSQGILGKPSKQQLDTVFGTHNDTDVVTKVLESGREQTGEGIKNPSGNYTNVTRGSGVDVRGSGGGLRGV